MSEQTFISYSWDDDTHKAWARALAERLRSDGVPASIDQWETVPGDQLPAFMERAVKTSNYVLIVCTPRYKEKSEKRSGGVGYEGDIITGELLLSQNHRKFIPVLRRGEWTAAAPGWLSGKYYVDLRDGPRYEQQYQDLLSTILGTRAKAPPVGTPQRTQIPRQEFVEPKMSSSPTEEQPVRILGVIADDVGEPRNDGTRGSALYAVPFRLSKPVSSRWGDVFTQVWNHPPQWTSMHRPGIARVRGDRIILDGTTMDEVQKVHRDTLLLCVKETNRIIAEQDATAQRIAQQNQAQSEQHRQRVRDVADGIRFDD